MLAGPPGLEPGTSVLETEILPLNYGPKLYSAIRHKYNTKNRYTPELCILSRGQSLFLNLFVDDMLTQCRVVLIELKLFLNTLTVTVFVPYVL